MTTKIARITKIIWAAPGSAVGLFFGAWIVLFGGRARRGPGIIEVTWREDRESCGRLADSLHYRAITFGHVVLAVTGEELQRMRAHELVHVRQYEHWGPVFLVAYPLSGVWQWLRGRRAYKDNYFEVQARSLSAGLLSSEGKTPDKLPKGV